MISLPGGQHPPSHNEPHKEVPTTSQLVGLFFFIVEYKFCCPLVHFHFRFHYLHKYKNLLQLFVGRFSVYQNGEQVNYSIEKTGRERPVC